ncbi:MAG: aromatic ring-hydroxylating dioxygenase subunit alpha [Rhizomicrobium sp.]
MEDATQRSAKWKETDIRALFDEEGGTVDSRIYTDQDLYDLEMERLFGRSWLFLAHESQFKKTGDYFATYMGDDPVIVVRQQDGSIKAFLNQCRHRGMRICRNDGGNARAFTCPYHGWAYDIGGNLVNVPMEKEAYGAVDKRKWSATAVPRVEHHKGLIFGNWDVNAPSLADYLGEARFYMDAMLDRAEGGTEMIGGVIKWVVPCNWKLAAEQFCSDMYHVFITHASGFIAMAPPEAPAGGPGPVQEGLQFRASWGGHGSGLFIGAGGFEQMAMTAGVETAEYWCIDSAPEAERRLGRSRGREMNGAHMTVFPSLSFLAGTNAVRVWHPRGPNEIEIWAFTLVDAAAPDNVKEQVRLSGQRGFGPSGIFEQDDGENWVEVQRVLQGHQARKTRFNVQMGLGKGGIDDARFPGRLGYVYSENAARGFYAHWLRMMTEPNWSTLGPTQVKHAAE